ncbi:MAG: hypothetical protein OHK0022_36900 [Roseiflexaceae bacterium]
MHQTETIDDLRDEVARLQARLAALEGGDARPERRYRTLADAMPQLVWATDADGAHFYFNQRWYEYTGMAEAESEGFGFANALHPDDRERTLRQWQRAWRDGEGYEIEYRFRRHDGVYQWFIGRAVPVADANGAIVEWVGTCTNIDEQKRRAEVQGFLAEASKLLADTLDYEATLAQIAKLAVPQIADWCAIDIIGEDGEVRRLETAHIDPSKVRLAYELNERYPYDPDAPTGVPQVLRTGQPEFIPEISDELLVQAIPDPELLRIMRDLGLRSSMVVPLVARGRMLGAITLVAAESQRIYSAADLDLAMDLARRAAVAVDNARLHASLRRSEERYRELADAMPLVVWTAHADGAVDYFSQRWYDYTGQPVEQSHGHGWEEVVHPEDLPECLRRWNESVETGQPYEIEYRWRRSADGEYRWHLGRALPVRGRKGRIRYWVGSGTEIDEQKRTEQALRDRTEELAQLTRALEERNRELDQFAYVTSHDLKAPLRGIAHLSQWIEEDLGEQATKEIKGQMKLLRGRVHRMEGLIDGILQYSRVGRVAGTVEQVAVGELLEDVIDLLAPPPHVTITIAPEMPTVESERLPLQQVFANLIQNAIKHNDRPAVQIAVGWAERGDCYAFSVRDNGPGIAPQYHERIFGIFQTLAPRDKVEGSGLGLALIKKIVEHQGGQITLDSAEGAGATFCFTWPQRRGARGKGLGARA